MRPASALLLRERLIGRCAREGWRLGFSRVYQVDPARGRPGLIRHHVDHEEHIHIRFIPGAPVFTDEQISNALAIQRVL